MTVAELHDAGQRTTRAGQHAASRCDLGNEDLGQKPGRREQDPDRRLGSIHGLGFGVLSAFKRQRHDPPARQVVVERAVDELLEAQHQRHGKGLRKRPVLQGVPHGREDAPRPRCGVEIQSENRSGSLSQHPIQFRQDLDLLSIFRPAASPGVEPLQVMGCPRPVQIARDVPDAGLKRAPVPDQKVHAPSQLGGPVLELGQNPGRRLDPCRLVSVQAAHDQERRTRTQRADLAQNAWRRSRRKRRPVRSGLTRRHSLAFSLI